MEEKPTKVGMSLCCHEGKGTVGKGLSRLLYYPGKCFNSRFPGQGTT